MMRADPSHAGRPFFQQGDRVWLPDGTAGNVVKQLVTDVLTGDPIGPALVKVENGGTQWCDPHLLVRDENFGTEVPPPRTEPPKLWVHHRYHWLDAERAGGPSVAEWLAGSWYCANEIGPVSPEEIARRGWQWLAPAIPPSRTRPVDG